jgi:hypothetical protein
MLDSDPNTLPRKRLEEIRGFLMYVAQTYTGLTPFMIGFHLKIDSWRPHRDAGGWQLMGRARWVSEEMAELNGCGSAGDGDAGASVGQGSEDLTPLTVSAVPRFTHDIDALMRLTKYAKPPLRKIRASSTASVGYGYGDASGRGFGATVQIDNHLYYHYGRWNMEDSFGTLSNWKELGDVVMALEQYAKAVLFQIIASCLFSQITQPRNRPTGRDPPNHKPCLDGSYSWKP